MAFDWIRFLDDRRIPYSDSGANVSAGNIVVHCPLCGMADSGQHLSISLDGRGWRCFRNHSHAGRNPTRLVQALLQCSWAQAAAITGTVAFLPGPDEFQARVAAALQPPERPKRPPLAFLPSFRKIASGPVLAPYRAYLERRGYSAAAIDQLSYRYGLRVATSGPFQGRIIFPVYADGELVTWTGRTISRKHPIRYRTLSDDPDKSEQAGLPCALGPISDYLLFEKKLRRTKARVLYLCEGPFDALRICVLGRSIGVMATCFFTSSPSQAQVSLLHEIIGRFESRFLLLDNGMISQTMRTLDALSALGVRAAKLPGGFKDPGDLTKEAFIRMHNRSMKR